MPSTLGLEEFTENVGRLFMVGMSGTTVDSTTRRLIEKGGVGGIILFRRNIENPLQLASLCNDLQAKAMASHGVPLFLAVDQEGGRVSRLREPFTQFSGNTAMGQAPDPVEKAMEYARTTAMEMAVVGLNMNLAPVVDVPSSEPEKHLAGRTFSDDPAKVSLMGQTVVRVLQEHGIMSVAKHFPGLGKTGLDPHHELPTISVDEQEMQEVNLVPFKAVIKEGVSGIMTSHAIYPAMDPGVPATLSEKVLSGLLRKALGFQGLILSDDLEMGAIDRGIGVSKGAAASFQAGADILLICQRQERVWEAMEMIKGKLLNGEIPLRRMMESLGRIRSTKERFLRKPAYVSLERVRAYFDSRPRGSS